MVWFDKHNPKSLKEIKGNKESINKLKDFIINFKNSKKKSILLVGPAGIGKTCSVYAFAKENNYEVLELNASDSRNKGTIEEFMGNAMNQQSLFRIPKIILIDEIDGLSGTKDRGGAISLAKLIEKTNFPIVMTANDISLDKLSSLLKKAEIIEFSELENKDIVERLKEIAKEEKMTVSDFVFKSISSRSGGDMRAAITDFQTLAIGKSNKEDLEIIGDRKKEQELNNILKLIFKSKDIKLIDSQLFDVNLDELSSWVGKNVSLEYDSFGVRKSFDKLSKSDVFKGRIRKRQYWRFLVYQKYLMSSGVALAKDKRNSNSISYKRPRRGLYIWQANMRNIKRKNISNKLASYCRVSNKRAFREMYPQVINLLEDEKIRKELEID